jgi:hypothetical protein
MSKVKQIKLGLTNLTQEDKLNLAQTVFTKLTGNANFPSPNPTLAVLNARRQAVVDKNNEIAVLEADLKMKYEEKGILLQDLDTALLAEAGYVQTASMGDATKILSSGFGFRAPSVPIGPLPAPQSLHSNAGDLEGTVECQWDAVRGTKSYIAECAPDSNGPWTQFYVGSVAHCEATGLVPGKQYWFRARAVGPLGPGPWSDPSFKRAS